MNIVDPSSIPSSRPRLRALVRRDSLSGVARPEPQRVLDSFSQVARRLRAAAAQSYASFEVGSTQAKFLRQLGEDAPLSQAELARKTVAEPTLTGRVLQPLIERGGGESKR